MNRAHDVNSVLKHGVSREMRDLTGVTVRRYADSATSFLLFLLSTCDMAPEKRLYRLSEDHSAAIEHYKGLRAQIVIDGGDTDEASDMYWREIVEILWPFFCDDVCDASAPLLPISDDGVPQISLKKFDGL